MVPTLEPGQSAPVLATTEIKHVTIDLRSIVPLRFSVEQMVNIWEPEASASPEVRGEILESISEPITTNDGSIIPTSYELSNVEEEASISELSATPIPETKAFGDVKLFSTDGAPSNAAHSDVDEGASIAVLSAVPIVEPEDIRRPELVFRDDAGYSTGHGEDHMGLMEPFSVNSAPTAIPILKNSVNLKDNPIIEIVINVV